MDAREQTNVAGLKVVSIQNVGAQVTIRKYYRLPGSVDEPFLMVDYSTGNAVKHWVHQDRLGSVIMATNDSGNIVNNERYVYDAYGNGGTSPDGFPFRFTGQRLDPETGLYFYKAR